MTKERVNEIGKVNDFATWLVDNINSKRCDSIDMAWEALEYLEEAVDEYFNTAHNFQMYTALEDTKFAEHYAIATTESWKHLNLCCTRYEADVMDVITYFTVFNASR